MKEKDYVAKCVEQLERFLPGAFIWKIADQATGGIPDLEVDWHGATTKIEFKLLKKAEQLHDKWEDGRQLVTCVQLEKATGRCWVVVFQKASVAHDRGIDFTYIYRPTALLNRKIPIVNVGMLHSQWKLESAYELDDDSCLDLWDQGVLRFNGMNYKAVVDLILRTHRA